MKKIVVAVLAMVLLVGCAGQSRGPIAEPRLTITGETVIQGSITK
jgi:hypothetical protein